jgi:hypothetical protein
MVQLEEKRWMVYWSFQGHFQYYNLNCGSSFVICFSFLEGSSLQRQQKRAMIGSCWLEAIALTMVLAFHKKADSEVFLNKKSKTNLAIEYRIGLYEMKTLNHIFCKSLMAKYWHFYIFQSVFHGPNSQSALTFPVFQTIGFGLCSPLILLLRIETDKNAMAFYLDMSSTKVHKNATGIVSCPPFCLHWILSIHLLLLILNLCPHTHYHTKTTLRPKIDFIATTKHRTTFTTFRGHRRAITRIKYLGI